MDRRRQGFVESSKPMTPFGLWSCRHQTTVLYFAVKDVSYSAQTLWASVGIFEPTFEVEAFWCSEERRYCFEGVRWAP